MEAAKLLKQKSKISKGKLKKTIKNVLSRPDPVFWPKISEAEEKVLEATLIKHKVLMPQYKKLKWNDLKLLPKEQRPKPPKIDKVKGLLFGIAECLKSIQSGNCSGIIIEYAVNPQTIVHPVLEACTKCKVPVVCFNSFRKISKSLFGISTSCLGVSKNMLTDISDKIYECSKDKWPQDKNKDHEVGEEMTVQAVLDQKCKSVMETQKCPFLYRTSRKARVFIPPSECKVSKTNKFIGHDFIEFADKVTTWKNKKAFKKMIVKRISSNLNRTPVKK